jgi:hypothetical protein
MHKIMVSLPAALVEAARQAGGGNVSKGIRQAMEETMERMRFSTKNDDGTPRFIHDEGCQGDGDPNCWQVVQQWSTGETEYRCEECGAVWTDYHREETE